MSRPTISLTTDFGQADSYVGIMKGVILAICREASLVDISHKVHPQAVQQAAYLLSTAAPYFPVGTVHLLVVDPGVGSERRAIAVQTERATYVAPDNGVLDMALRQDPPRLAVQITNQRYHLQPVSATFHGRDIFAPIAAHLACGTDLREVGEPISPASLVSLPDLQPQRRPDGSWLGHILHVDHFGNLITNYPCSPLPNHVSVLVGGERIWGPSRTFAAVAAGALLIYAGSSGYLEIAVRNGNAAERLRVGVGHEVEIQVQDS